MKKLLLIASLAITLMAKAQTITIGEGTALNSQVPTNTFYSNSLTEQLFFSNEIEFAGNIKAIRFRIAYSYSTPRTSDIEVYMKHVSKNKFSDPDDCESFTPRDKVYAGQWTIPADTDDWIAIDFDTPFAYNGSDNLLIAINEHIDNFTIRYFKATETENRVLSYFSDDQAPDPCNPSSFTGTKEVLQQRPNIKLVFGGTVSVADNPANTLSAYPNPANSLLYLDGADNETVSLYDASGRLVRKETYSGPLRIDDLESGIYAVVTNKGVVKIVKE